MTVCSARRHQSPAWAYDLVHVDQPELQRPYNVCTVRCNTAMSLVTGQQHDGQLHAAGIGAHADDNMAVELAAGGLLALRQPDADQILRSGCHVRSAYGPPGGLDLRVRQVSKKTPTSIWRTLANKKSSVVTPSSVSPEMLVCAEYSR